MNIKKCDISVIDHPRLFVLYRHEMQSFVQQTTFLFLQKRIRHLPNQGDDFLMSINMCFPLIFPLIHTTTNSSDQPDDSHDMINMFMRNKDFSNLPHVDARFL